MTGPVPVQVFSGQALPIDILGTAATVTVTSGDTVYYSFTPYVNATTHDGTIALSASQTFTQQVWLRSVSLSSVTVTQTPPAQDIVLGTDNLIAGPGGTGLTSTVLQLGSPAPTDLWVPTADHTSPGGWKWAAGGSYTGSGSEAVVLSPSGGDDTTAIQTAINTVFAAGGGTVFFRAGTYTVGGALQTTDVNAHAGYRTQLVLPFQSLGTKVNIKLLGEIPQGFYDSGEGKGVIILSTSTGGTVTSGKTPAVLGGPATVPATQSDMTNIGLTVENICFRCPANPNIIALDARSVVSAAVRKLRFDTTDTPSSITQPTHPSGLGLRMPGNNNNGSCSINDIQIIGYYGGLALGEHTAGDNINISQCVVGLAPVPTSHGSRLGYAAVETCAYTIASIDPSTGVQGFQATTYLDVDYLDIENDLSSGTWTQRVANVASQASGALVGRIRYHQVTASVGVDTSVWVATGIPSAFGSYGSFTPINDTPLVISVGSGGSAPAWTNSWGNVQFAGENDDNVGFWRDQQGMVHLRGTLGGGTTGFATPAFTLPSGYRPAGIKAYAVAAGDATHAFAAWCRVEATGNVVIQDLQGTPLTGAEYYSLNGIRFREANA